MIGEYLTSVSQAIGNVDTGAVVRLIEALEKTLDDGRSVFIVGNGGSAATAIHATCDLNKSTLGSFPQRSAHRRFRVMCLSENVSWLTAIGNDISFDKIFSEQLKNMAREGDFLIVISGSGNSKNIISVIGEAKQIGVETFGLLGFDGGAATKILDQSLVVKSSDYGVIEDAHLMIFHLITEYFKRKFSKDSGN